VLDSTRHRLRRAALTIGPGLIVMLADNDAGSVITAAQSGARWGYRLLLLQLAIFPLLFVVQELCVRLGLATGKGFGELVRLRFGRKLGSLSVLTLLLSCFGALVTQMSGIAGVGQLFGIPIWQTTSVVVALTLLMVWTGSYHTVERIAILFGLFGLAFVVVAWKAKPEPQHVLAQLSQFPVADAGFLYLVAANLGTSVMPWTVFYQQSALIDKGLSILDLRIARIDTLVGALVCQILTASVLVAAAATLGAHAGAGELDNIPEIARAFTAALGSGYGRVVFAVGLTGGAMVALIVVCLSAAWAVGEAMGRRHSLEQHPGQALDFYAAFTVMLLGAGLIVCSGVSLVRLAIATGVANAVLLPLVLGCLYRLARTELPPELRLQGLYAGAVATTFVLTASIGFCAALVGSIG
jgi:Mn2+/Fe2+ NRAMP family transporter